MAVHGRPTPQAPEENGERPRFKDRLPEDYRRPGVNPFVVRHREFGLPLLPASEAQKLRGSWAPHFGRNAPLHLEIGCGNGFFLAGLARAQPDWNVVGIELRYKRTVLCAKKLVENGVTNARIARYHAAYLDDLFQPGELSGIYVNHPDPWPKERHEKNRLISRWFLEDVVRYLKPGGELRLKSDFQPNVDRFAEILEANDAPRLPLEIIGTRYDIHVNGTPWDDDIETNYQRKMRNRGMPVHAICIRRQ